MSPEERDKILNYLCPHSRKCLKRTKWRHGRVYRYNPRHDLLKNLADILGVDKDEVHAKLMELRSFVLLNPQYF